MNYFYSAVGKVVSKGEFLWKELVDYSAVCFKTLPT